MIHVCVQSIQLSLYHRHLRMPCHLTALDLVSWSRALLTTTSSRMLELKLSDRFIRWVCFNLWTLQTAWWLCVSVLLFLTVLSIYTVFHKKTSASYFHYFSIKCWPILIMPSLLHCQINCRKTCNKIYHLTSNLLWKLNVQLCNY